MSKRDEKRHRYAQLMLAHRQEWQRYAHNQTKLAIRKDKSAVRTAFASTSSPEAAMKKVEAYHKGPAIKVWENVFKAVWLETGHAAAEFMHEYLTGKSVNLSADVSNKNAQEIQTLVWKDPVVDTVLSSWDSRVDDKIMNGGFLDKIEGINSTTQDKIHRTIQEGVANGEGHYIIGQNIESHLDETWAKRGETISRTETNSAMNAATREDMKATAPDLWKTWSIAGNNTRPWHEEVDGESIPQDEMFIVDGEEMDGPGDDSASPSNVINCECTQLAEEPPAGTPVSDEEQARIDEAALAESSASEGIPEFNSIDEAQKYTEDNLNARWTQPYFDDNPIPIPELSENAYQRDIELKNIREAVGTLKEIETNGTYSFNTAYFGFDDKEFMQAHALYNYANREIVFSYDLGSLNPENVTFIRSQMIDKIPYTSEITPRATVFHEFTHMENHFNGDIYDKLILGLSDTDKASISKVSQYAEAAANQITITGQAAAPGEAYAEAVGAVVDNSPRVKYIPDSVLEQIFKDFPWLK